MKHRIFLALVILLSLSAFSQTPVVFDHTNSITYQLSYTQSADQSQRIVNDMLEVIARSMNKPVRQTRVHLNIEEHVWITKNANKLTLYVSYEDVRLSGDFFYKGFDVSNELIPSHYSFECSLKRKNGTELKKFTANQTAFRYKNSEHRFDYTDTLTNGEYKLQIISKDFTFKPVAFDRFRAKCSLIDQYYGSDIEIANCYRALNEINPENFRQIKKSQTQLEEMIARISRIQNAPFWGELNVHQYDPINLYPKLADVDKKIDDLQRNLDYVYANLYRYYFDSGLQFFNSNKRNEARNDFRQSYSLNNQYPQTLYYLSLMEFQDKNSTNAMDYLSSFFSINPIDQNTYLQATGLAKEIEKVKISEVNQKVSQQLFSPALSQLDVLELFCKKIINYTCHDSIFILRNDIHNKVYQAHLNDAQKLLNESNFEDAIANVNKALKYQSDNFQFVTSNEKAIAMMQKVNADYYLVLVKRGKAYSTSKDYRNAFTAFELASTIESNYPVKKDKQLSELTRKAKLEVLLLDIVIAQNFVITNNLAKAREQLMTIISDQAKYNLKDHAKLNQQVELLKQSIFSKQCMNAQAEYDREIASGNDFMAKNDFINALAFFEKAKTVSAKNPDCQLSVESAVKGVAYTQNPAKYQQDLMAAKRFVDNKDFSKATSTYNALVSFYTQNGLYEYPSLNHLSLTQFMLQYGPDYILWGASYMANKSDFNASYTLLESLRQSKVSRSKTKNIQKLVANGFAIADYKANMSLNAKVKVLEYSKGDKWYKYFVKQYQKQIKSFKK